LTYFISTKTAWKKLAINPNTRILTILNFYFILATFPAFGASSFFGVSTFATINTKQQPFQRHTDSGHLITNENFAQA